MVLMIAYGFPPVGGSTVIRVIKFCKYLARFNWEPAVLTVKHPRVFELDPELIRELPDSIRVYRTPSLELPVSFYKGWITGSSKRGGAVSHFSIKKILGDLFKKLRYFFMIIDERIGWVPFVIFRGWRICRNKEIKVIYVAVKPFSLLLAAIALKKITRLPLVIDFHDAWTSFNPYFWSEKPAYLCRLEQVVENAAVRCADKVISVNDNIIRDFREKYLGYDQDKFISICNGYDTDDFSSVISVPRKDKFIITYAGSLYTKRSPENFINALKMLIRDNPVLKERVRFCYIGKVTIANQGFFQDDNLKGIIEFAGMLPHADCIKRIRESNLLLFIEDQVEISQMLLPTKIFEYVASGRPILSLAKDGPAADLILESRSGIIINNSDISAIKEGLRGFISGGYSVPERPGQQDVIKRYSHEAESGLLSGVLNGLLS